MSLIKVKDHSSLRRDDQTGAIVSVNNEEWGKVKKRRTEEAILRERDASFRKLEDDVRNLTIMVEKLCEPKPTLLQRIFGSKNTRKREASEAMDDISTPNRNVSKD